MFNRKFDERICDKIETNFTLEHDRQRPRINFEDDSRHNLSPSVSNFLNPTLINVVIAFDLELLLGIELQLKPNFDLDN